MRRPPRGSFATCIDRSGESRRKTRIDSPPKARRLKTGNSNTRPVLMFHAAAPNLIPDSFLLFSDLRFRDLPTETSELCSLRHQVKWPFGRAAIAQFAVIRKYGRLYICRASAYATTSLARCLLINPSGTLQGRRFTRFPRRRAPYTSRR